MEYIERNKMKLTKKERDFLIDWLSDDLHIELENRRDQDISSPIARKFLPIILKKLERENNENN